MTNGSAPREMTTHDRVTRTPGVCGGAACVAGTRIPLWVLAIQRAQGETDEQILDNYPSLSVEDLAAAWAYYQQHHAAVVADQAISTEEP